MAKKKKSKYIFGDGKVTVKEFRGLTAEQQKRILNDRSKRVKVVDAALPKEWLDRRVQARYLRNPITPGASETGRELDARRRNTETLMFGEGDRQLADREKNQQGLEDRADAWFLRYQDDVKAANERAASAAAAQAESGRQMVQGVTASANADRDRVASLLREQAAQLGAPSQEAQFRTMADGGIAARGAQLASGASAQNAVALAAADYAAARVRAAGLDERENQMVNTRRRDVIAQDKKDYDTKKTAWREKFITDAIAEARKQVIEDRLAVQQGLMKQAEIDLKNRTLAETIRSNKAKEDIDRTKANKPSSSGGSSKSKSKDKSKSNDLFKRALATVVAKGVSPQTIIKTSQKGLKSNGQPRPNGVEWFISHIIAKNKTENISREVAKRAVYTYIKYNGRIPGGVTVKNAPKTPPWRK